MKNYKLVRLSIRSILVFSMLFFSSGIFAQERDTVIILNSNLRLRMLKVNDFDSSISITNGERPSDSTAGIKDLVGRIDFRRSHNMKLFSRVNVYRTNLIDNYMLECKQDKNGNLELKLQYAINQRINYFILPKGFRVSFELLNKYGDKIIYIYNLEKNKDFFLTFESKNITLSKKKENNIYNKNPD